MIDDASGLGEVRRRRLRRPRSMAAAQRRTIPFDYAFRYQLTGDVGRTQSAKVEVSVEAIFTAVSIGYGAVPDVTPVIFGLAPRAAFAAAAPVLTTASLTGALNVATKGVTGRFDQMIEALAEALGEPVRLVEGAPAVGPDTARALKNGFKLNPDVADAVLGGAVRSADPAMLQRMFQVVAPPPALVQFKYALFDDATGREFQSEPIFNLAGLGSADGRRPFRYFARPIEFAPRSMIRMQITEVSGFQGELHVSLQGYKVLGGAGTPTGRLA